MILVMILLMFFSMISAGMYTMITSETQSAANHTFYSQAYYAAAGALEKMTNDLNKVYQVKPYPDVSDFNTIMSNPPTISGFTFTEYRIDYNGASKVQTISDGPYEGLVTIAQPYKLFVTARHNSTKAEVRLRRDFLNNLIPLFQFGVFNNKDLEFHAGPPFDFGGRVHTNGNLYLTAGTTLTFRSRVTAVGEVVRDVLKNGDSAGPPIWSGQVLILDPKGNPQELLISGTGEGGSMIGGTGQSLQPPGSPNSVWPTYSPTKFGGNLLNYQTGAKPIRLPIELSGIKPIELIRRGAATDSSMLVSTRYYYKPGLRITLSDLATQVPGGGGCQLGVTCLPTTGVKAPAPFLLNKYLKVEIVPLSGGTTDITQEFLNLGITVGEANAVIRLQRNNIWDGTDTGLYPINFYDMREGEIEDAVDTNAGLAGVMNAMEIDVGNLGKWLTGAISGSGASVPNNGGYLVYTSDRRGDINFNGVFDYPDTIFRNGVLDPGEDLNEDGLYNGTEAPVPLDVPTNVVDPITGKNTFVYNYLLKDVTTFRRALRLVNGSKLVNPLTVATENPIYVLGDYNIKTPQPASLVGDSVTVLSGNWDDANSYNESLASRPAASTTLQAAILAGGTMAVYATPAPPYNEPHLDGGVHNFIRFLENWNGQTMTYVGSMINMFYSRQAIGQWKCCQTVYSPPSRSYTFDTTFLNPATIPPQTPRVLYVQVERLRQELLP